MLLIVGVKRKEGRAAASPLRGADILGSLSVAVRGGMINLTCPPPESRHQVLGDHNLSGSRAGACILLPSAQPISQALLSGDSSSPSPHPALTFARCPLGLS